MEEQKVIYYTVKYLIEKREADISQISVQKLKYDKYIIRKLKNSAIPDYKINNISFKRTEGDIIAHFKFKSSRRQKYLVIEAKGGDVYYGLYTCLGQFICSKNSPSTYYWFGFALPYSWRIQFRKKLKNEDGTQILPIVNDIINNYTKNGQGLWFYFVKEDGTVIKETWKQTLSARK